ncbi:MULTISPECIES: hypothetical protein [unclassified Oceanobacillus]|uniref:hypothetical protein n=1 Tax=unclassified Oceanobacillus TaxID=2630292 RepID=UPI001BE91A43|nr:MULTISPECIES: hypothetical protein [unclassified Oceanobacillus]MBT2601444.1 hypothetical protein [Oceanobacillus sp. ISL-74]MBT2653279.1 hypothetical protein [Oceanobacillus sp. ISL-73]
MPTINFTEEEISMIAKEVSKQLLPEILKELKKEQTLPSLMTRKQFMEFAGISNTKCNELFNREDFPVTRELGHPKVKTDTFLKWLDDSML